jgi:hypothetical protein
MVNEPVRPLLALGLEGLERAKTLFVRRLLWHAATLCLLVVATIAVTFLHDENGKKDNTLVFVIECLALALAVVTEFMALRTHHAALAAHSLGRQVMRRVMLFDAHRPEDAVAYHAYVSQQFPESVREAAKRRMSSDPQPGPQQNQLSRYYHSSREPSLERLRDHLLESAMFSQRLYHAGWTLSIWVMGGFLLTALVVLGAMAYQGLAPGAHWGEFSIRLLITLLAFIPASQELDHAMLYRMMSERLSELIKRVEKLWDPAIPPEQLELQLLAEVGDYGADTTFAPPIRTLVYKHVDPELSQAVAKRLNELDTGTKAGVPTPPQE